MNDAPSLTRRSRAFLPTVALTFAGAGSLLFGCHVPDHYAAGMVGTLEVAP